MMKEPPQDARSRPAAETELGANRRGSSHQKGRPGTGSGVTYRRPHSSLRTFPFSARNSKNSSRICSVSIGIIMAALLAVASLRLVVVMLVDSSGGGGGKSGAGAGVGVGTGTPSAPWKGVGRGGARDEEVRLRGFEEVAPRPAPEGFMENLPQTTNKPDKSEEAERDPTAETCDDYLKTYGILPQDSWGTAPEKVKDSWKALNCNRVLAEEGFSLEDPPTRGRERVVVVIWNDISGWLEYSRPAFVKEARETCPTECVFTEDQSLLSSANGVLFHGPTHRRNDFPSKKPEGSKYVFINLEPATLQKVKALLRDDEYMSRFDLTMTYEGTSDVPLGYVGAAPTARYFHGPKFTHQDKDGLGVPDAIAAFVSNCKASGAKKRAVYMRELMTHAAVHSYGGCLNNKEEPVLVPGGGTTNRMDNKVEVLIHYKFFLAFENNDVLRDYVTEKVYNGLQAGTLPVYWGARNVEEYVPRGSIVKASDFDSPKALAEHLLYLAEDEDAYEEYFKWRDDPVEEERFQNEVISRSAYGVNAMCRLCDRLLQERL